nr:WAT1-related protein At2g39510-like [Ipomoea batatas]
MVNVRLLEATVKSNTVLGQWGARSTPSAAGINLVRVIVLDEVAIALNDIVVKKVHDPQKATSNNDSPIQPIPTILLRAVDFQLQIVIDELLVRRVEPEPTGSELSGGNNVFVYLSNGSTARDEFGYAGLTIVVKFALNQGMSPYTYLVYRNVFAALAVAPFAIFFERKVRPKMTISTFLKITVLGLVGYAAVLLRDAIHNGNFYCIIVQCSSSHYIFIGLDPQAITLKSYPTGLSLTTLICTMGALQGSVVALVAERKNLAAWALHWDTKLLAMVYSGVICSGVTYYLSGIIIKEKGPVFVTAFNPLSTIISAIMGSFILAEQLDLGMALGAVGIMVGLYMVIWGKKHDNVPPESTIDGRIVPVDELPSTLVKPPTNQEPFDTTTADVAGDDAV